MRAGEALGHPATLLILSDGRGRLKAAPVAVFLPKPFSVARFNPTAIEQFLARQAAAGARDGAPAR